MGKLLPFGYPADKSQEINFARGYANGITKYMANGKKISHLQIYNHNLKFNFKTNNLNSKPSSTTTWQWVDSQFIIRNMSKL